MRIVVLCALAAVMAGSAFAADEPVSGSETMWKFSASDDSSYAKVDYNDSEWQTVEVGHAWKSAKFAWFRGRVTIPDSIEGRSTGGQVVGLKWNACDGGECYLNGSLYTRYDNDHPAVIVLSDDAQPGDSFQVAVRVFMGPDESEKDGSLGEAELCILNPVLVRDPFLIAVDPGTKLGEMPMSFAGLSQGAGLPDYDDATAALFKDLGIKWFRMDNVLTNAVKKNEDGTLRYDWTDLDTRLDFMKKVGCEFIFCISYMPEALDAVPNPERHSYPRDWDEFGNLVYAAAKHCIDRGTPVKYWEVWNEINTGWMVDPPGWDHLKTYTTLYDTCWKAIRKADPTAWIGGPASASGPWDENDPRGPGVNGEKFMRGIMEHCENTGAPLDFITWHEYFQPHQIMKKQADQVREYLEDYPKVKAQVKEFSITEWNYAWWHDRAHDNEVGAAWAAASMLRGWMAAGVQKPCFFLAKDFSAPLRGEWGMFARDNKPKAVANVCKMFNMMAPVRVRCAGEDEQIASIASVDPDTGRTTVLIISFAERYGSPRKISVWMENLPSSLANGICRQYLVDATHSNLWNSESDCDLQMVRETPIATAGAFEASLDIGNNSVVLLEFEARGFAE